MLDKLNLTDPFALIIAIVMVVFILYEVIDGYKKGFLESGIRLIGYILLFVGSYILKNPLSVFLYTHLPFFKFGGLTSLNIIMYEALAFMICIAVLSMVLSLVIKISGIIEKLLKLTIILALPSKILGMIVGAIQAVVVLYVALFVVSMPVFNMPFLKESKYAKIILDKTPVMSQITNDALKTFNEIAEFTKNEINIKDIDTTNGKIVEIMLKNDIVTVDSVKLLNEKEKIRLTNLDELVNKYEEDK